jgi:hypothetical protein
MSLCKSLSVQLIETGKQNKSEDTEYLNNLNNSIKSLNGKQT